MFACVSWCPSRLVLFVGFFLEISICGDLLGVTLLFSEMRLQTPLISAPTLTFGSSPSHVSILCWLPKKKVVQQEVQKKKYSRVPTWYLHVFAVSLEA